MNPTSNADVLGGAVTIAGSGALVLTLVLWFVRRVIRDVSTTATENASQQATRAQVTLLREEIQRLEVLVRDQSTKVDTLNNEIVKLRLAFVDEQAALLRVLGEFSSRGDDEVKARIAQELEDASKRRAAVMSVDA